MLNKLSTRKELFSKKNGAKLCKNKEKETELKVILSQILLNLGHFRSNSNLLLTK